MFLRLRLIEFRNWTDTRLIRHTSFGLLEDNACLVKVSQARRIAAFNLFPTFRKSSQDSWEPVWWASFLNLFLSCCSDRIWLSSIQGAGGLVTRTLRRRACLSRHSLNILLKYSNYSSGSSHEYQMLRGSVSKSLINCCSSKVFIFLIYIFSAVDTDWRAHSYRRSEHRGRLQYW